MKYQNGVAALVTDVIAEPAPIQEDRFEFGVDPNAMHIFDVANGTRVTGTKPAGALV